MADLITSVGTVISNFCVWFTSICSGLIDNPLIQLMFGMGVALLLYKLLIKLVGKASFRSSRKRR